MENYQVYNRFFTVEEVSFSNKGTSLSFCPLAVSWSIATRSQQCPNWWSWRRTATWSRTRAGNRSETGAWPASGPGWTLLRSFRTSRVREIEGLTKLIKSSCFPFQCSRLTGRQITGQLMFLLDEDLLVFNSSSAHFPVRGRTPVVKNAISMKHEKE